VIELGLFAEEESVQLLVELAAEPQDDFEAATILAMSLGNLPVAVANAGAYVSRLDHVSLRNYAMRCVLRMKLCAPRVALRAGRAFLFE
jgi:hypothetical protein